MSGRFYYDRVHEHLQLFAAAIRISGIPDEEMPPAVADFLLVSVLAMASESGLSDFAAEAIIGRMRLMLDKWRAGEPPFGAGFNGLLTNGVMQ